MYLTDFVFLRHRIIKCITDHNLDIPNASLISYSDISLVYHCFLSAFECSKEWHKEKAYECETSLQNT